MLFTFVRDGSQCDLRVLLCANDYSAQHSMQYLSASERIVTTFVFRFQLLVASRFFHTHRATRGKAEGERERKIKSAWT